MNFTLGIFSRSSIVVLDGGVTHVAGKRFYPVMSVMILPSMAC